MQSDDPKGLHYIFDFVSFAFRAVELVKCETNDLEVPANADFVIEGYVDPREPLRDEGPFGDRTGPLAGASTTPAIRAWRLSGQFHKFKAKKKENFSLNYP